MKETENILLNIYYKKQYRINKNISKLELYNKNDSILIYKLKNTIKKGKPKYKHIKKYIKNIEKDVCLYNIGNNNNFWENLKICFIVINDKLYDLYKNLFINRKENNLFMYIKKSKFDKMKM